MLRNQKGMTLLEIMIVLVIVGGLSSVLVVAVQDRLEKANLRQAKIQLNQVGQALDMYYTDCGYYPTSDEGLDALMNAPGDACEDWGPDPYLKQLPKDPWKRELYYEEVDGAYMLISNGPDRKDGTKDDICSGSACTSSDDQADN
ncbi:MAG: type II secretion system protein GspG [Bdellovibrionaceae bacterium]|nr:type II secretion system protein GspG [Pseudobdellovibrionaceae bacterium]|tara:strand:+ start:72202 stop:72636 length:435 start_codon:yes stop_codon:yes gene_type:complete